MTHLGHDFAQRLFEVITSAVSMFLLIVLFYILQYVFDMNFVCSCRAGVHPNGVLYLAVPPLILTFVVNIIEPFHQKRIFYSHRLFCSCCTSCNNCCSQIFKLVIRYFSLSTVWVSTVLFDGDWYFCLMTNLNISQTGIPCRVNLTYHENRIKDAYKTDSLDIGFGVICGFLFLWSIVEIRRACCVIKNRWECCSMSICVRCSPYYSVVYDELLAEQVSSHLTNELQKIATERAKVICTPYLQLIETHEQQVTNTGDGNDNVSDTVSEAWEKISAFDFYLTKNERQEDPHAGSGSERSGFAGHNSPTL